MKRNQILLTIIGWALQVFLFCQIPVDFTTNIFLAFVCMGLFFLGWILYSSICLDIQNRMINFEQLNFYNYDKI